MRILAIVTLGILSVPTFQDASTVSVRWKRGTEFGEYETYTWVKGVDAVNRLSHQRIVSAIENELAIKGLWMDDQSPDLHLSYYASVKDVIELRSPYRTDWYDEGTVTMSRIHEGTLVLDVADAAEDELVWRGSVTDSLTDDPRRNDSKIADAVRKLLEGFPPN